MNHNISFKTYTKCPLCQIMGKEVNVSLNWAKELVALSDSFLFDPIQHLYISLVFELLIGTIDTIYDRLIIRLKNNKALVLPGG